MPDPTVTEPVVIGIAGHAKSGKTTLARALSRKLSIPTASFGETVEQIAQERGLLSDNLASNRAALMRLGEELVTHQLSDFCSRVLTQGGWQPGRSMIVEGIRHAAVVHELRRIVAPTRLFLVMVNTAPSVREARLAEEKLGGPLTRATMDAHSTEREVSSDVMNAAHCVVDGGEVDPAENAEMVITRLQDSERAQD